MAVTETKTIGYGSRVKSSFGGIGTGLILFAIGTCLLWWNEGRAVKTAKMLAEAEKAAVHVEDVSKIDPSLEGQLIHASAEAIVNGNLEDPQFGVSENAVKLERQVEYYQFHENSQTETKDKLGGSQEQTTTYTCEKGWTSSPISSSEFHGENAQLYKNFTLMQFDDNEAIAENVKFGAYRLSESLIRGISGRVPTDLKIDDSFLKAWNANITAQQETPAQIALAEAAAAAAKKVAESVDSTKTDSAAAPVEVSNVYKYVHVNNNEVYFGVNPNSPQIGDVRVTFTQVNPGMVTVVAQVSGDSFEPYTAKNGKTFSTIRSGKVSVEKIFQQANEENGTWTWVLRLIGIVLVCTGLKGVFNFLVTILKVVPFLANILNWGVGLVCNVIGIAWSLIIIAIAWIFYRPLLGIAILAAVGALIYFFVVKGKGKKPTEPAVAPEAPAAPAPAPEEPKAPEA